MKNSAKKRRGRGGYDALTSKEECLNNSLAPVVFVLGYGKLINYFLEQKEQIRGRARCGRGDKRHSSLAPSNWQILQFQDGWSCFLDKNILDQRWSNFLCN